MRVIAQASIIGLTLVGSFDKAIAQAPAERTVERLVNAVSNKDTRIGVYLNVLADCTSGPLPTIRRQPTDRRQSGGKDREGEGYELQGLPCIRSTRLRRVL
jgi:hypothetical protein